MKAWLTFTFWYLAGPISELFAGADQIVAFDLDFMGGGVVADEAELVIGSGIRTLPSGKFRDATTFLGYSANGGSSLACCFSLRE